MEPRGRNGSRAQRCCCCRPPAALPSLLLLPFFLLAAAAAVVSAAAAPDTAGTKAQLEAIAQRARQLIKLRPAVPELQLQLALALHRLNDLAPDGGSRIPEAEAAYRAALRFASPSAAEAALGVRANLGVLLMTAGRLDDAIAEFEETLQTAKALGVAPGSVAAAVFNKGKALGAAGRLSEADEAFLAAARDAAGADLSTYGKALAAAQRALPARDAAAAARVAARARALFMKRPGLGFLSELDPAIGLDPEEADEGESSDISSRDVSSSVSSVSSSSGGEKESSSSSPSGSSPSSSKDAKWLEDGSPTDLSWLHFAIYKRADAAGRSDAAWALLEAANRLMRAAGAYDPATERGALAQIKSVFAGPLGGAPPAAAPAAGDDDAWDGGRRAVFVVGAPRSGSTLVEQMLGSHSQVFAAGEDTLFAPLASELAAALADPSRRGADPAATVEAFGRLYVDGMRARAPAGAPVPRFVVDKMLANIWRVGHILAMLPNACIIHAARHPLDAALSIYAQPFAYEALPWAWDLDDIAEQIEMIWELAAHWEAAAPGRVHTVYYERLVSAPEPTIRAALSACGVPFEPAVLSFHAAPRAGGVHTASQAQVRRPLYASSVGRWRAYERQLGRLKERLAPVIAGYEARLEAAAAAGQAESQAAGGAGGSDGGGGGSGSGAAAVSLERDEL